MKTPPSGLALKRQKEERAVERLVFVLSFVFGMFFAGCLFAWWHVIADVMWPAVSPVLGCMVRGEGGS